MTLKLDFTNLDSDRKLNLFLAEALNLPARINGNYGYNLAAFWDTYSYLDDADTFELYNTKSVIAPELKYTIEIFIKYLEDLKGTNPNFSYKILS